MRRASFSKKALKKWLTIAMIVVMPVWHLNDLGVASQQSMLPGVVSASDERVSLAMTGEMLPDASAPTDTWKVYLPSLSKPAEPAGWPMAGANPQRTSWTSEQVPSAAYMAARRNRQGNGMLYPQWAKPIAAYIPQKVQIIAANDTLYVSTARGLYALNPATGATKWVFPTELPLGHSPTIEGNVAYVGGLTIGYMPLTPRRKSLVAYDGAGAGFDTNHLLSTKDLFWKSRWVYVCHLCQRASAKRPLAWRYKTDVPFTSRLPTGVTSTLHQMIRMRTRLTPKPAIGVSPPARSAGFHSWWPVVLTTVVFAGSSSIVTIFARDPPLAVNIDVLIARFYKDRSKRLCLWGRPFGQRGADG
jgi:hypothetical protein